MTKTARLRLTEIPLYIGPITVESKSPDKVTVLPQNCDCKVTQLSAVEALFGIELCDKHEQLG